MNVRDKHGQLETTNNGKMNVTNFEEGRIEQKMKWDVTNVVLQAFREPTSFTVTTDKYKVATRC